MDVTKLFQLKPEEEILEVVHETIVPSLPKFLGLLLWLVVPFFLLFPLFALGPFGVIIFILLVASAVLAIIKAFLVWSRTVFVITDRRIIDIDQKGFFDREVTEASFRKIDEVSYRVKGVVATIFRYGSVRLHMRGSSADIEFLHVSRPARVHDLINDLRNA